MPEFPNKKYKTSTELCEAILDDIGVAMLPASDFGFNSKNELQYRGRLDASRKESGPSDLRRDLFEGMKLVAETGKGPTDQVASMGCSIKWK